MVLGAHTLGQGISSGTGGGGWGGKVLRRLCQGRWLSLCLTALRGPRTNYQHLVTVSCRHFLWQQEKEQPGEEPAGGD